MTPMEEMAIGVLSKERLEMRNRPREFIQKRARFAGKRNVSGFCSL